MFPKMAELIPEGESGDCRVEHFTVDEHMQLMASMRGDYLRLEKYAKLIVDGRLMMTDTPHEHQTNFTIGCRSFGDVLIAGLGLGMVVAKLNECDKVSSITVVEKSADVIRLVAPYVASEKLMVIQADIFEFKPQRKYDVIYFDIWPDITTDNLDDMAKLHRRFGRYRNTSNPNSWMDSWCRSRLLNERRREKSQQCSWR